MLSLQLCALSRRRLFANEEGTRDWLSRFTTRWW